jgi:hypothetical protein
MSTYMLRCKLRDRTHRPLFMAHVPSDGPRPGDLIEYAGRYFVRQQGPDGPFYREERPFHVLNVEDDYLP